MTSKLHSLAHPHAGILMMLSFASRKSRLGHGESTSTDGELDKVACIGSGTGLFTVIIFLFKEFKGGIIGDIEVGIIGGIIRALPKKSP